MNTKTTTYLRFLPVLALFAAVLPGHADDTFIFTLQLVGPNVVATGSDTLNDLPPTLDPTSYLTLAAGEIASGVLYGSPGVNNLIDSYSSRRSIDPTSSKFDSVVVLDPNQLTYDFDFGSLLYGPPTGNDQQTTLAVDSVSGNNANAGTLQSPQLTLPTSLTSNENLGIYRGSRFQASLPLATNAALTGVTVRGLSLARGALPIFSALDPVVNSACTLNSDNTYSYTWTAETAVANDGYQNVYVVEINTATEAQQPVASRRRMTDVTSQANAAATAGAVYLQSLGSNRWKATLRPTDNLAPGSGSYRYEVVTRFAPAQWGLAGTTLVGNGTMSGLELVGSSDGYGGLSAPTGFAGDRLAMLHGTTHNAVLGGGSLARSVFYEAGDASSIQLAWYTANPAGLSWTMNQCLFFANVGDRPANFLIAHSGGANNYDRGDVSDCAFLGAPWSDGSLRGAAFSYHNVNAGVINRVYLTGVADVFDNFGNCAAGVEVTNSVFRQVGRLFVPGSFHDNVVEMENISDPVVSSNRGPTASVFTSNQRVVANNLFYLKWSATTGLNGDNGGTFFNQQSGVTGGTATRNIVILGGTSGTACYANLQSGASAAAKLDYNLVINLGGDFRVFGGEGNSDSWADYRTAHPLLDPHSLFMDLSGDPRGIKTVFTDPDHGDFRWAQTDAARQCAAYCQANNVGPATVTTHWPLVPTVDEAVAAISLLPPNITSPGAVAFTKGVYSQYRITTDLDGTPVAPTNYSVAGQPSWLSVTASSGVITGTPPQVGDISISVSATNLAGMGSAGLGIAVQTAFMAWQGAYFNAVELNNPAVSGPYATPAGDGIPNLLKYALGLNPKTDGTGALPTTAFTSVGNSKFLTLTYSKSLAASDVTYTVEVSGDLRAWSSGANDTATVSTINNATGTMQTVVQRDLTATSSARQRFIRLKINQL